MRPTLTLKKRPTAPAPVDSTIAAVEPPPAKAVEPVEVAQAAQTIEVPEPLNAVTPVETDKPKSAKEAKAEANRLLNEEQQARRAAHKRKLAPFVRAYMRKQSVLRETVQVDGVVCLRPLAVGIHKTIFRLLRSLPETEGCSNTVITELIKSVIHVHLEKVQYLHGLLKFPHRFDLDGNAADAISEEQRVSAQELLNQRRKKKTKADSKAV